MRGITLEFVRDLAHTVRKWNFQISCQTASNVSGERKNRCSTPCTQIGGKNIFACRPAATAAATLHALHTEGQLLTRGLAVAGSCYARLAYLERSMQWHGNIIQRKKRSILRFPSFSWLSLPNERSGFASLQLSPRDGAARHLVVKRQKGIDATCSR